MKRAFLLWVILLFYSCSPVDFIEKNKLPDLQKKNEISLVTYNIEAISEKEESKVKRLVDFVNKSGIDIVLFQELFHEGTREEIAERLNESYISIISRIDYNSFPEFLFQDAGIFMASKFPLVEMPEFDFGDDIKVGDGFIYMVLGKEFSRTYDFLANKSVLGAFFQIDKKKKLFLITTHVQALGSNENKEFQLKQIYQFIEKGVSTIFNNGILEKDEELVVILAGDFNVDAYNKIWKENRVTRERMLEILGNPRDLHMEYNGNKREYTWNFNSNRYPRRFDYVLAYDSLNGNKFVKMNVKEMELIDIKDSLGQSISDHRGIKAVLKFLD